MRIAINTRLLIPSKIAGEGNYIYHLLLALSKIEDGNEYLLLFDRPYDHTLMGFALQNPKFQLHVIGPKTRFIPSLLWWLNVSIPRFLKENEVDLLFCPEGFVPLHGKIKTVLTIHDLAYKYFPKTIYTINRINYEFIARYSALKATRIVAVSQNTSNDIQKYFKISSNRISVIYHGIKTRSIEEDTSVPETTRNEYAGGTRYILFVGTLEPRKNIENLILAYRELRTKGYDQKLLIVGRRGWKYSRIFRSINELNLTNHVNILGYQDEKTLIRLYRSADLFVYVPLYEGFGMPVTEAMAFGTPIVTSNVSALPEIAGNAAEYVNPLDPTCIMNGIHKVLSDQSLRQRLGNCGIERSKVFSWEKSAYSHLALFNAVNLETR